MESSNLRNVPLRVGLARLKVRDLERVSAFYRQVIGLQRLEATPEREVLGTATTPLLELIGDAAFTRRDSRAAGLFHIAFLLPSRRLLAQWLAFALRDQVRLLGASDHIVSEGLYLTDPEGNGVELYADTPLDRWRTETGAIRMETNPLDLHTLLAEAPPDQPWTGFPPDGCIGHLNLQVGDIAQAQGFYRDVLGFAVTATMPGACFFATGAYHHQIAGNVWNSHRAGPRPQDMAGLEGFTLLAASPTLGADSAARAQAAGLAVSAAGDTVILHDPWGLRVDIIPGT